jgi:hypothetical protein
MSQTTPIQAMTLNTATRFRVSVQSDRVRVANDSSNYLLVYFGAQPPSLTSPLSSGWHETVGPGDHPLIYVPGAPGQDWWINHDYGISGPFEGSVWIMPFSPAGVTLPGGGVLTGASFCYVTSYAPNEPASGGNQTEAFVQGAKQGRYQGVEGGCLGVIGTTSNGTADKTRIGVPPAILTPANAPNLFAANAAVAFSVINIYIYHYFAYVSPGAGLSGKTWSLEVAVTNAAETVDRDSLEFGRYAFNADSTVAANINQSSVVEESMPHPLAVALQIPQNTLVSGDLVVIRIRNTATVGTYNLFHNVGALVDLVNMNPLTAVPTVLYPIGFVPSYNATYNPQTY